MNHCSCDWVACSCSCIDGKATLRMVLSITTTIRQMQRTPRIHQRRDWTRSSLVPSLVSGARESTLTLLACPTLAPGNCVECDVLGGIRASFRLDRRTQPAVGRTDAVL